MGDEDIPARNGQPASRVRVVITNIPAPGDRRADRLGPPRAMAPQPLLEWLNGRCGDAERAHDGLKNGLAGGTLPCGRFGANACWWWAVVLAFNLQALIGITVLEPQLARAGWKRIRSVLLIHAGRLIRHGRQWILVLRRAGTEELQKALARLSARPLAPG